MAEQWISITISDDGMKASASPAPSRPEGMPDEPTIRREIEAAGVVFGVDEMALAAVIRSLKRGDATFDLALARGQAPKADTDCTFVPAFESNRVAAVGQVLGRVEPGAGAVPGRLVTGAELPPRLVNRPTCDDGVAYDETDRTYRALQAGYPRVSRSSVAIDRLVVIDEDGMAARLVVQPGLVAGGGLDEAALATALREAGVRYGVYEDAHARFLEAAASAADEPVETVVAQGRSPIPGQDGSVRFMVPVCKLVGQKREDGSIDYHERLVTANVEAGMKVAQRVAADAGTEGMTVTGQAIPASPGKPCELQAGQNITASPDGSALIAAVTGELVHDDREFWVTDCLHFNGDLDFSVGNLDCSCRVDIKGSVRSSFRIRTKGSIAVGGAIEDAIVESGGSVEVAQGIIRHHVGAVRAKGMVTAAYVQNADIQAHDSIAIKHSAMRSHLAARHRVTMTEGKGVLIGGSVLAGECVEVKVIGSEMHVPTKIRVGVDFRKLFELDERLCPVQADMADVMLAGGEAMAEAIDNEARAKRLSGEQAELLGRWRDLKSRCDELIEQRRKLLEEPFAVEDAAVAVIAREGVYPGTEIFIGEAHLKIDKAMSAARFALDAESGEIKIS